MKRFIAIPMVVATLAAGCHEPIAPTEPTSAQVQAPGEAEFDRLWEASLAVLRDHDFPPIRRDRRAGVIETLPTTAQTFFEFWRKDTIGTYEYAEANLHTIRRYVTVRLTGVEGKGSYSMQVEVQTERLTQPERQVTSAAGALRTFSDTVPTREGVFPGRPTWVSLGRDGKMERYLLAKILARYGEPISLEQQASSDTPAEDPTRTAALK